MAGLKTTPNEENVISFLNNVKDEVKRKDCFELLEIMEKITGEKPKMWGGSIVGFGTYHYVYPSGREGDWFLTGFAPRKQNLTVYIIAGFARYPELMSKLGKFKTGKSCLYMKKLQDVNYEVLKELIEGSVQHIAEKYR